MEDLSVNISSCDEASLKSGILPEKKKKKFNMDIVKWMDG